MAKKYLIGKLKGQEPGNLFESEEQSDTGANSSNQVEPTAMNTYVTIGMLYHILCVPLDAQAYPTHLHDNIRVSRGCGWTCVEILFNGSVLKMTQRGFKKQIISVNV